MRIKTEIYKNDYLNIKNKNWNKERSNSYYVININQNYKDDNCILDTSIEQCKICYHTIWKNNDFYICDKCNKKLCKKCFSIIKTEAINRREECKCPYCRQVILKRNANTSANTSTNTNTNYYFRSGIDAYFFDILLKQFFILFIQFLFIIILACLVVYFILNFN